MSARAACPVRSRFVVAGTSFLIDVAAGLPAGTPRAAVRRRAQVRQLQRALAAMDSPVPQVPEYSPIRCAGHESGEFFFLPKGEAGPRPPPEAGARARRPPIIRAPATNRAPGPERWQSG